MTSSVKHATRKPLPAVSAVAAEQRSRNRQLRNQFPPRPVTEWWPDTAAPAEGATIAEIVAKTGITRTSLYRHLPPRAPDSLTVEPTAEIVSA